MKTIHSPALLLSLAAFAPVPAAQTAGAKVHDGASGKERSILPAPPAGGLIQPNLGMHQLKKDGELLSGAITLLPGTIAPASPAPLGTVIGTLYLPDAAGPFTFDSDEEYPLELWFDNSDPSGSLDGTALDAEGDPIHFNLHYPHDDDPLDDYYWLEDVGLETSSPPEDLEEILDDIVVTGSKARVAEALDILLGTNASGALSNRAYNGFELLKYKGRRNNRSYDPVTRNVAVTQLWYGTEIYTDCNMLMVPAYGDYTITWHLIGLGDIGPNRERAFPIDEFTAMPMKETANGNFWYRNNWVWKWFDIVDPEPGDVRKFSLENLFKAHTGTSAAPSYKDLNPSDPRYWLHTDRKFDFGTYVGQHDIQSHSRWITMDLDLSGAIGGYLVDGTNTGAPYDAASNPAAQFNQYANNEYAVPRMDWSQGTYNIPHFSYDSSFTTVRKGQGIDLTVRYGQGMAQAGIYVWGWRSHPPRINWIESYSDEEYLPSGAPKDWRFGHKWDEVAAMGVPALGDHAPEVRIYNALVQFDASAGTPADVDALAAEVDGLMRFVHDRRGLPPTPDVADFPNPDADVNILMSNLDFWSDRERVSAAGKDNFREGDVIVITVHNDDNFTRFFRTVDFGTTDYQYVGTDMGILDWKPVFGFPQIVASAWTALYMGQGFDASYWTGTEVEAHGGNPFYVDPLFEDLSGYWGAGERDLFHPMQDLAGYSGPGFHNVVEGAYTVWGNNYLAGKPLGDPDMWKYAYGKPVPANTTLTFHIEMPRSMALNNGAMYMFDPQFHHASIGTNHPVSELKPEALDD